MIEYCVEVDASLLRLLTWLTIFGIIYSFSYTSQASYIRKSLQVSKKYEIYYLTKSFNLVFQIKWNKMIIFIIK